MIVIDSPLQKGSPSYERISAFSSYFEKTNKVKRLAHNTGFLDVIKEITVGNKVFFISMPPFSKFWLFLIPGIRIILDIRDGWSIAQKTGYGGTVNKMPVKAFVSRAVEKFIIWRSIFTITCTPKLQQYLSSVSGRDILLIPNGISKQDLDLIKELKASIDKESFPTELIFCCAGQFSEYGADKVKTLLKKIVERYPDKRLVIQLLGSDPEFNAWVPDYFDRLSSGRGRVVLVPRMNRELLFCSMLKADFGLVVLRDPDYDFGTKIYDYIALGLSVVNYFDAPNNFTNYFDAVLDKNFVCSKEKPEICREYLIESGLKGMKY